MLLLSTTLLITLTVCTHFIFYELYENSKGPSSPALESVFVLKIIVIDFFPQVLLLEQINERI